MAPESPLRRINLGFRTKILLLNTAVALLLVFLFFAAGSYYVNRLQKANMADAVQLAQDQAVEVGRRVSEVLAKRPLESLHGGSVPDELSGLLELNLRFNRTVTWVGLFDAQGNCVVERNSNGETIVRLPENAGEPHRVELPTGVPGQSAQVTVTRRSGTSLSPPDEQEVRQPLDQDGMRLGEIRLRVAESPVYLRMTETSRNITQALVAGCVVLLLAFLSVYGFVSRMATRQVELVRQTERTERMAYVGTLASGLAHEIRNPLSAMNVNLEVLREDLAETRSRLPADIDSGAKDATERAIGLAGRVQQEIAALGTTLSHFLDFALPSKEGMTEFPIRGLLEELLELHREQCRLHGIAAEITGDSGPATVIEADRRLLHQVFRNILINAILFLEESVPRRLRIRVAALGQSVAVEISDTGPGIPAEKLPHIFEAFYSGRKGGTGLGLALAKKIIEEHHGSIDAANNTDSPGVTFRVVLPVRQPA